MKITLPLPLNRGNAWMHWRTEVREKKAYWLRCDVLKAVEGERGGPGNGKHRVSAKFFLWSAMDEDNLMARLKWPLDWLVANDYIRDDSPKHIQWAGLPEQFIDRKNQRVEFVLEEMS